MQQRFTDREIEEYLDGVFEGEVHAMEAYLQTQEGAHRLDHHKALYTALKNEPEAQFSLSLERSVLNTIAKRSKKRTHAWDRILWIAGGISVTALLFCCVSMLRSFSVFKGFNMDNNVILLVGLIALVLVGFNVIEVWERQARYKKFLDQ